MTEDNPRFHVAFQTRAGSEKEGPLGVLWTLIESYEVDIFSVSLSRITADFLDFMARAAIGLEDQAEFTHTAARLIFYKSRQLLPNAAVGEDVLPDTLPYELVEQLLEYKKMQQAADAMRHLEERSQLRVTRDAMWQHFEHASSEYLEVDLISFLRTFRDFLEREEKSRPMQIADENISVTDMIDYLKTRLIGDEKASFFRAVMGFSLARIVACFLGLLEMAKMRMIQLGQDEWLGDIHFWATSDGVQLQLGFGDNTANVKTSPSVEGES